jgi:hypothetical protein
MCRPCAQTLVLLKKKKSNLRGEKGQMRRREEVNLIEIHCKHLCICHNVPPVQLQYAKNKKENNLTNQSPKMLACQKKFVCLSQNQSTHVKKLNKQRLRM